MLDMARFLLTAILAVLCISNFLSTVNGNALLKPQHRGMLWTKSGFNSAGYNYMGINCGGINTVKRFDGQCGLCGDPYDATRKHETGGKYATGEIAHVATVGEKTMPVSVLLNTNQGGYFEFSLCESNGQPETQHCFDMHLLKVTEGRRQGDEYGYYPNKAGIIRLTLEIPEHVSCDPCVLQWKYVTGNTWGRDETGHGCRGCGPQETFVNCADIAIEGWGTPAPPPVTYPRFPTTTPYVHHAPPRPSPTFQTYASTPVLQPPAAPQPYRPPPQGHSQPPPPQPQPQPTPHYGPPPPALAPQPYAPPPPAYGPPPVAGHAPPPPAYGPPHAGHAPPPPAYGPPPAHQGPPPPSYQPPPPPGPPQGPPSMRPATTIKHTTSRMGVTDFDEGARQRAAQAAAAAARGAAGPVLAPPGPTPKTNFAAPGPHIGPHTAAGPRPGVTMQPVMGPPPGKAAAGLYPAAVPTVQSLANAMGNVIQKAATAIIKKAGSEVKKGRGPPKIPRPPQMSDAQINAINSNVNIVPHHDPLQKYVKIGNSRTVVSSDFLPGSGQTQGTKPNTAQPALPAPLAGSVSGPYGALPPPASGVLAPPSAPVSREQSFNNKVDAYGSFVDNIVQQTNAPRRTVATDLVNEYGAITDGGLTPEQSPFSAGRPAGGSLSLSKPTGPKTHNDYGTISGSNSNSWLNEIRGANPAEPKTPGSRSYGFDTRYGGAEKKVNTGGGSPGAKVSTSKSNSRYGAAATNYNPEHRPPLNEPMVTAVEKPKEKSKDSWRRAPVHSDKYDISKPVSPPEAPKNLFGNTNGQSNFRPPAILERFTNYEIGGGPAKKVPREQVLKNLNTRNYDVGPSKSTSSVMGSVDRLDASINTATQKPPQSRTGNKYTDLPLPLSNNNKYTDVPFPTTRPPVVMTHMSIIAPEIQAKRRQVLTEIATKESTLNTAADKLDARLSELKKLSSRLAQLEEMLSLQTSKTTMPPPTTPTTTPSTTIPTTTPPAPRMTWPTIATTLPPIPSTTYSGRFHTPQSSGQFSGMGRAGPSRGNFGGNFGGSASASSGSAATGSVATGSVSAGSGSIGGSLSGRAGAPPGFGAGLRDRSGQLTDKTIEKLWAAYLKMQGGAGTGEAAVATGLTDTAFANELGHQPGAGHISAGAAAGGVADPSMLEPVYGANTYPQDPAVAAVANWHANNNTGYDAAAAQMVPHGAGFDAGAAMGVGGSVTGFEATHQISAGYDAAAMAGAAQYDPSHQQQMAGAIPAVDPQYAAAAQLSSALSGMNGNANFQAAAQGMHTPMPNVASPYDTPAQAMPGAVANANANYDAAQQIARALAVANANAQANIYSPTPQPASTMASMHANYDMAANQAAQMGMTDYHTAGQVMTGAVDHMTAMDPNYQAVSGVAGAGPAYDQQQVSNAIAALSGTMDQVQAGIQQGGMIDPNFAHVQQQLPPEPKPTQAQMLQAAYEQLHASGYYMGNNVSEANINYQPPGPGAQPMGAAVAGASGGATAYDPQYQDYPAQATPVDNSQNAAHQGTTLPPNLSQASTNYILDLKAKMLQSIKAANDRKSASSGVAWQKDRWSELNTPPTPTPKSKRSSKMKDTIDKLAEKLAHSVSATGQQQNVNVMPLSKTSIMTALQNIAAGIAKRKTKRSSNAPPLREMHEGNVKRERIVKDGGFDFNITELNKQLYGIDTAPQMLNVDTGAPMSKEAQLAEMRHKLELIQQMQYLVQNQNNGGEAAAANAISDVNVVQRQAGVGPTVHSQVAATPNQQIMTETDLHAAILRQLVANQQMARPTQVSSDAGNLHTTRPTHLPAQRPTQINDHPNNLRPTVLTHIASLVKQRLQQQQLLSALASAVGQGNNAGPGALSNGQFNFDTNFNMQDSTVTTMSVPGPYETTTEFPVTQSVGGALRGNSGSAGESRTAVLARLQNMLKLKNSLAKMNALKAKKAKQNSVKVTQKSNLKSNKKVAPRKQKQQANNNKKLLQLQQKSVKLNNQIVNNKPIGAMVDNGNNNVQMPQQKSQGLMGGNLFGHLQKLMAARQQKQQQQAGGAGQGGKGNQGSQGRETSNQGHQQSIMGLGHGGPMIPDGALAIIAGADLRGHDNEMGVGGGGMVNAGGNAGLGKTGKSHAVATTTKATRLAKLQAAIQATKAPSTMAELAKHLAQRQQLAQLAKMVKADSQQALVNKAKKQQALASKAKTQQAAKAKAQQAAMNKAKAAANAKAQQAAINKAKAAANAKAQQAAINTQNQATAATKNQGPVAAAASNMQALIQYLKQNEAQNAARDNQNQGAPSMTMQSVGPGGAPSLGNMQSTSGNGNSNGKGNANGNAMGLQQAARQALMKQLRDRQQANNGLINTNTNANNRRQQFQGQTISAGKNNMKQVLGLAKQNTGSSARTSSRNRSQLILNQAEQAKKAAAQSKSSAQYKNIRKPAAASVAAPTNNNQVSMNRAMFLRMLSNRINGKQYTTPAR